MRKLIVSLFMFMLLCQPNYLLLISCIHLQAIMAHKFIASRHKTQLLLCSSLPCSLFLYSVFTFSLFLFSSPSSVDAEFSDSFLSLSLCLFTLKLRSSCSSNKENLFRIFNLFPFLRFFRTHFHVIM